VLVNDERHHCESQGMIIESEVDVEVIAVEGTRLVVKIVKQPPAGELKSDSEKTQHSDAVTDDLIDFEIPES